MDIKYLLGNLYFKSYNLESYDLHNFLLLKLWNLIFFLISRFNLLLLKLQCLIWTPQNYRIPNVIFVFVINMLF